MIRFRSRSAILAGALLLVAVSAQSAGLAFADQAGQQTLTLASGTTPTSFSINGGSSDQATVVSPLDGTCGDRYGSIDGASWITATATVADCAPNAAVLQTTDYSVSFTLPAGATAPSISGSFFADNVGTVKLNGSTLAAQGEGGASGANYGFSGAAATPFSSTSGFLTGVNTLTFTVKDESSVTGLDYTADVTYDLAADLAITVDDGSDSAIPGTDNTYTIAATNNGPGDVTGATIDDAFPPALSGITWTCTAGAGASCGSSNGAGNLIGESVDIPSGGTATFVVKGTIDPGATANLDDTGTISAPAGVTDPNPANDSATDSDTLTQVSDLAASISASSPQIAGTGFDYTVKVTNGGPSDNDGGYLVTGTLPAGIAFDSSGTCSGGGTSFTCATPTGLPAGQTDTYTVHVKVAPSVADGSVLSAAAVVSGDATDPNPGNDSADADVTIIARADLQPTMTAPGGNQVAGDPAGFDYGLTVADNGPSNNDGGYSLAGTLPTGITFASAKLNGLPTGDCATSVSGFTCTVPSGLAAGATDALTVHVLVDHSVPDSTPDASVTVSSGGTVDPNGANDTAHTSPDVTIVTRSDLVFDSAVAAGSPIFANGTPSQNTVTYTLKFHNVGPSDARHSTLKIDPTLAAHLASAEWCQVAGAITCAPTDTFTPYNFGTGIDAGSLAPAGAAAIVIHAHGIPTDRNGLFNVTQGFTVSVPAPTTDPNTANNAKTANSITVDTVPSPVRNVQAVAGNGNAIVTFEPPTNNGGQPVTSYKVTVSPVGGGSPITVLASSPQVLCPNGVTSDCYRVNVSPLTNGTLYTIDAQAQNAVGLSDVNDGVNPAAEAKVTPSVNASASIIAPAASGNLTTCAIATPASPTCVQYIIPSGTGGVFGALGNLTLGVAGLPANLCGGSACIGQGGTANNQLAGAQNLGALAGYNDRKKPLKEIVTWDVSTIQNAYKLLHPCGSSLLLNCYPNDVPVYYETSFVLANFPTKTGTLLNLHFCGYPILLGGAGNGDYARPKPIPAGPYNGYFDTAGSGCIQKMTVLSSSNPAIKGDVQVTINLTSDSDSLAGHR